MPTTIRDVAKLAGTSIAAVSVTLNSSAGSKSSVRVSAPTRARIQAAAQQLGYVANPLARGLASGKTGVLGLVFPYSGAFIDRNPFCSQIMAGVFTTAIEKKQNIMLYTAIGEEFKSDDQKALRRMRTDGLLLVLPTPNNPVMACSREEHFPCVAITYQPTSPSDLTVNADDLMGGRIATEHLITLGHRRIAHLIGIPEVATTEPRKCGYQIAMHEAGLEIDPRWLIPAGFDWSDGYKALKRLLHIPASQRPTAIFAANDLCAEGVLRAMRSEGLRAPDDFALIGYDDTWFASMTRPPLTSVRMPIQEMGARATEMLIERVQGRELAEKQVLLPVSLTIRETCGAR